MLPKSELVILWAWVLVAVCHASPINRQAGGQNTLRLDSRNQSYTEQNVCVNDDVLYQPGDLMPAPNPCSRCVCNPPGSQCTPVACEKKPGCKALLRPNQCCPEYQCECERNGQVYQNGERLDNAENPCEACYCQGGEVVCTTVECYKRDDCEPQYVKGKCCPKYDHCPPLVMDDPRFSGQSAGEKTRPHHTRSTFQPDAAAGSASADSIDQAIDASNVQERVHVPENVAAVTVAPGDKPISSPAAEPAQEDVHPPEHDKQVEEVPVTLTPTSPQGDDEDRAVPTIKIEVPAVPWTESPIEAVNTPQKSEQSPEDQHDGSGDDETQTQASANDEGSGMADTEVPIVKTQDEGLIGVIEHITEAVQADASTLPSSTDQTSIEGTTIGQDTPNVKIINDEIKNEEVEEKTEGTVGATEATEQGVDSTTVSAEFTGLPEEMITTAEPVSELKDVTETHGVDLPTESLIIVTTPVKEHSLESSTDSSPEFKDFDEWSGTKSSEFQRDSSSLSSSSSSSSSDSHVKHSVTSSDESTSHVLATNINSEKVKPTSESEGNVALGSSSHGSESSDESDSTEGSATTEISDSDISESTQKNLEDEQKTIISKISNVQENIPIKTNVEEAEDKNKIQQQKETSEGQLNIVLDTDATDENGPPILLIGDELANHQMDIVVATTPAHNPQSVTENSSQTKPESRTEETDAKIEQKSPPEVSEEKTTPEKVPDTTPAIISSNANDPSVIAKDVAIESQTEDTLLTETTTPANIGLTGSDIEFTTLSEINAVSNTEKVISYAAQHEMMLSDDPLPGQVASVETVQDTSGSTLGKTEEEVKKDKETGKHEMKVDSNEVPITTTLAVSDTTESSSIELKTADLQTESPDRESTTNTVVREDVGTTEEPQYEATTNNNDDILNKMSNENKGFEEEKMSDRRVDILADENTNDVNTESATDNPSTIANTEPATTVMSDTTEKVNVEKSAPSIFDEKQNSLIIEKPEEAALDFQNIPSELKTKDAGTDQSITNPPEDVTATESTEDAPTTQNSIISKADKVKDFANEEMLLGDQPQTVDSSLHLLSVDDRKQINEKGGQEKTNKEDSVEDKTEMNLESAIIHEEIHNSESEQESEATQNIEEQSSEIANKSDLEQIQATEQNNDAQEIPKEPTNSMSYVIGDIVHETETPTENSSQQNNEMTIQPDKSQEQNTPILVNNSKISKVTGSEELATPPPDTTLTDSTDQSEEVTTPASIDTKSAPQNDELEQAKEKEPETTTLDVITEQQTNAATTEFVQDTTEKALKINPEILELKPIVSSPASNTTELQQEADVTTMPPQWLKSENETKLETSQEKEKSDEQTAVGTTEVGKIAEATVQPTERAEEITEDPPAITTLHSAMLGSTGEQRLDDKKAVEDADKKDLFILEDFFTKLYRHQIATDATKH